MGWGDRGKYRCFTWNNIEQVLMKISQNSLTSHPGHENEVSIPTPPCLKISLDKKHKQVQKISSDVRGGCLVHDSQKGFRAFVLFSQK